MRTTILLLLAVIVDPILRLSRYGNTSVNSSSQVQDPLHIDVFGVLRFFTEA
jgi:hypothetical protein